MKSRRWQQVCGATNLMLLMFLVACGGGSSSSSGSPPITPSGVLAITTPSLLPGTLQNHTYTATLTAVNGQGALKWTISPVSPTALFVTGLSIDPATGVLSGTVNFGGTAGFVAEVSDSTSQTASKSFSITAGSPLQAGPPLTYTAAQYQDIGYSASIAPLGTGGVYPLTYTLNSACLPFGLRLDNAFDRIVGSAMALGTYPCTVTIQDSFSPPEIVSGQFTIQVIPPPLSVANSIPQKMLFNRSFSGRVIAVGGIPPYQFSLLSGSTLPPGLSAVDPSGGQINGTPTTLGTYSFQVGVTDSSSPPQTAAGSFFVTVANPSGRNDTPRTATPITNGSITASISPYIDPPGNAPLPGDTDYYKLVSVGGATVHVETQAQRWHPGNLLDTVIEIVDGNNNRFTTCRQPGDTGTFASACINDDISSNPVVKDSALDFQVPGAANVSTTFYVHVLDWRGDARPDMLYELQVSGVVPPLIVQSSPLLPAARGLSYSQQLSSANGNGNVSWAISSGALPPGLGLNTSGAITGMATTDGTYSFTVRASDSTNPQQTATAQEVILVAEPVKITSSANMPDACVNKPYSFTMQTSGGVPPLGWSFYSSNWIGIGLDQSTGIFSGVSSVTGTFMGSVGVSDATTHNDSQQISISVKKCS